MFAQVGIVDVPDLFPCCSVCSAVVLLVAGVPAYRAWRAGRLTGDGLRSAGTAWAAVFLVGFLPGAVLFTYQTYRDAHGEDLLNRLLAGDEYVRLSRVEIEGQRQLLICDDPETLEYLGARLRAHRGDVPVPAPRGLLPRTATFRFAGGGRSAKVLSVDEGGLGFWRGADVGDGPPNVNVAFAEPMPPGMREVVAFLKGERRERRIHIGPAANEYDTTLKTLVDEHVAEWVAFLAPRAGLPVGPARLLDTDLSATLQADRLIRVEAPEPFALHLEFQSGSELGIPARMLRYNVAAEWANRVPVASVLVLLRPTAAASDQTGVLDVAVGAAPPHLTFRYGVLRVWQEPMDAFLSASPGLLPLAVLTDEAVGNPTAAFKRLRDRLREPDVPGNVAGVLAGLTLVLTGLRYERDVIREAEVLIDKILKDSKTYEYLLDKGRAEGRAKGMAEGEADEARRLVRRLGTKRLGPPTDAVTAALDAVADRERLERMFDAALTAATWDELLATP